MTPIRLDLARGAVGDFNWEQIGRLVAEMADEGRGALADAGCPTDQTRFAYGADIRYRGQQNEVQVSLPNNPAISRDAGAVREAFERSYEAQYGLRLPDVDIEIVAWRLSVHGPDVARSRSATAAVRPGGAKGERNVRFADVPQAVPVFERNALASGQIIDGPAIIEEPDTTVVILPAWRAEIDSNDCIIARKEA